MRDIKGIIRDTIVQPGMRESLRYRTLARVVEADEKNNICAIRFRDQDGEDTFERFVPVKVDRDTAGWFPKEKDVVAIEKDKKYTVITGPSWDGYEKDVRPKNKLRQDIYPDSGFNTLSGSIF